MPDLKNKSIIEHPPSLELFIGLLYVAIHFCYAVLITATCILSTNLQHLFFCIIICAINIKLLLIYKRCPICILEKKYLNTTMLKLMGISACTPAKRTTTTTQKGNGIFFEIEFFLMLATATTVKTLAIMLMQ
jgi:hypothetical protein